MAKWYYYDAKKNKLGPYSANELKSFARIKFITANTIIENEHGKRALASNVKGLFEMQITTAPFEDSEVSVPEIFPVIPQIEHDPSTKKQRKKTARKKSVKVQKSEDFIPPSPRQRAYLRSLGYVGTLLISKEQASELIEMCLQVNPSMRNATSFDKLLEIEINNQRSYSADFVAHYNPSDDVQADIVKYGSAPVGCGAAVLLAATLSTLASVGAILFVYFVI